ncbi:MAG: hypothetical protein JW730_15500 [Anaerolineales bacterium]|nr:hypothetical protein [Anaerolineales bacterium]
MNLQAQVGFDGFCKEDGWLPIHVEVENTGPDLNADIQVSYTNSQGGTSSTSMNVELPTTSRKEFFLYIYFSQEYTQAWTASLLVDGKVLKKVGLSTNCLSSDSLIFGVLADNPSTFDVLNDVKPVRGFVRVAHLDASHLPDRAQAWEALDALIVSNVDTGTLTPEQRQALKSWVAAGGKLLIAGGIHWQSTVAGLKDLMPVDLTTTSRVGSLSQLQAYVKDETPLDSEATLARGRVRAKAQVLLSQDGVPVIVQKPLGFGAVYFFAADPALQPLSNWGGMKEVYEHLLGSKSQVPVWAAGSWYGYRANQALATIPELGLPSILYICGLLGFYIVVIGPLNYFILRRMKRRELAWVTIPVLVVLFTCLAYGTGFTYRGATPILNRLAVAQAWDGVDEAQIQALVGVYSPVRAKYDLEASNGFVLQPFKNGDTGLQAGNHWTTLQQGASMVLPEVPLEIGAMRAVMVKGSMPALEFSHDLVITLSRSTPVLTGSITNKSQYSLKDAILVTSGNWTRLGTIAPGETKSARVSLSAGPNGPAFYTLDSMQILSLDYSDVETDEIAARRSAFLDTVLFGDYGWNRGNWGIYLIGWVDQVQVPAGLKDRDFKTIDTMLYVDSLSPAIKTEPGELRLPASLFVWESSTPNSSPYYTREVLAGGYTLRFQPAIPISFRTVKSIDLHLTNNGSLQNLYASAWDYEHKTWVRIPLAGEYTHIPDASRYVGPDGEIRIKIVSNQSNIAEVTASNISLVVEP